MKLPYSLEIESSILGTLLLEDADRVLKLSSEDFYSTQHQTVFEAIKTLVINNKDVDIITVNDEIKNLIEDSLEYLCTLTNIPTTAMYNEHLRRLKLYSIKRKILKETMQIQSIVIDGSHEHDIDVLNDCMSRLENLYSDEIKNDLTDAYGVMDMVRKEIEMKKKMDAPLNQTGIKALDKVIGGLEKQTNTIIAARPAVGKTAFAIHIMIHMAKRGNNVLFISREMSYEQVGKRLISNIGNVDGNLFKDVLRIGDKENEEIERAMKLVATLPIEVNTRQGYIEDIKQYARKKAKRGKLDLLVIDYIGLLKSRKKSASRREEIESISRQIKELANELRIPILTLSQLNRNNAKENRRPELYDLKESGAIEQDADTVLMIHKPNEDNNIDTEIIIAKNRNGETGMFDMKFQGKTQRFYEIKFV